MISMLEKLETLRDGEWLLIVAPAIEHLMTGTTRVGVMKDGVVKVMYEDGVIEERRAPAEMLAAMDSDNPSLFELVGFAQAGRPEGEVA